MRNFHILEAIIHASTHTTQSCWRREQKQAFQQSRVALIHKKKKKKTSETLRPGHRKTLRLSSRSAPAQRNISVTAKSVNEDNCVKQRSRPDHASISVAIPLNATRYVLNHTINPKQMPNVCVNDKTDEVILFLLKI